MSMVLLQSMNEADCLDHQHRRTSATTERHYPDRSAYRASGLVLRLVAVGQISESKVGRRPYLTLASFQATVRCASELDVRRWRGSKARQRLGDQAQPTTAPDGGEEVLSTLRRHFPASAGRREAVGSTAATAPEPTRLGRLRYRNSPEKSASARYGGPYADHCESSPMHVSLRWWRAKSPPSATR